MRLNKHTADRRSNENGGRSEKKPKYGRQTTILEIVYFEQLFKAVYYVTLLTVLSNK